MEFQVPQFIEQKPKIVGPFTLEQFFYILGAGAISFITKQLFSPLSWIFISIIAFILAFALAFLKINEEPLSRIIIYYLKFISSSKFYTWQRKTSSQNIEINEENIYEVRKKMGIQEKLKSLSLKVTLGKIFKPLPASNEKGEKYEVVSFITGEKEIAKRVDYK
jgi:hypothetical protein